MIEAAVTEANAFYNFVMQLSRQLRSVVLLPMTFGDTVKAGSQSLLKGACYKLQDKNREYLGYFVQTYAREYSLSLGNVFQNLPFPRFNLLARSPKRHTFIDFVDFDVLENRLNQPFEYRVELVMRLNPNSDRSIVKLETFKQVLDHLLKKRVPGKIYNSVRQMLLLVLMIVGSTTHL